MPGAGDARLVRARVDRRDRARGCRLAGEAHDTRGEIVTGAPRGGLAPQPIELGDVPVGARLVAKPLGELLDDDAHVAGYVDRRPPAVRHWGRTERQHRPGRPAGRRHRLERIEPDRDDEIGAAQHALLHARHAEHAQHQRVRIRERALRSRRREEGRGQGLCERPQPLRGIVRSAVNPREQQRPRRAGQRDGRAIERLGVRIRQHVGAARRRQRHDRSPRDIGTEINMDGAPWRRHREPNGVSDPVRRRLGLDSERFLASGHGRRMAARQQDHRRAVAHCVGHGRRRRRDRRALAEHDRAGCIDEVSGDRGHDARAGLARGERDGKTGRARGIEQRPVGARPRDGEETRSPGASEAVDDDVGDSATAHAPRAAVTSRSARTPGASARALGVDWPPSSRTRSADSPRRARRRPRRTARPLRRRSGDARRPRRTTGGSP